MTCRCHRRSVSGVAMVCAAPDGPVDTCGQRAVGESSSLSRRRDSPTVGATLDSRRSGLDDLPLLTIQPATEGGEQQTGGRSVDHGGVYITARLVDGSHPHRLRHGTIQATDPIGVQDPIIFDEIRTASLAPADPAQASRAEYVKHSDVDHEREVTSRPDSRRFQKGRPSLGPKRDSETH
jgi:hypothetical protein